MATPLTSFQEPGFFSEIQVSPSLFLNPGSTQVVGLIGTGKSTKTANGSVTRGTENYDILGEISSITQTSSNSVYRFPQSSFAAALVGTINMTTVPNTAVEGQTVIATSNGVTTTYTMPGSIPNTTNDIMAALNGMPGYEFELDSNSKLVMWASTGLAFTLDNGSINSALSLADNSLPGALRWDPAVTDSEFAPQAGQSYLVTYETPKVADDFAPQSFFSLSQVIAAHGDLDSNGNLFGLAAGAQAAFGNGASIVTCRQLNPDNLDTTSAFASEIDAALEDMESQTVSVLVPMVPLNSALTLDKSTSYLGHVSKMSSRLERAERTCILGMDETAGRLDILGSAPSWQAFMSELQPPLTSGLESKRVIVVNPGYATTLYKGNLLTVDGTYAAACLAGQMVSSNWDEATPMTRKALSTMTGLLLPDLMRTEKNELTSLGVTVLEANGTTILVRRAVTADGSSIANQEPSIVRAFDRVAAELRAGLENRFVGQKILSTTNTDIEAATATFLENLVVSEIIASYRNIKAVQNSVEPRQFDVSFEAVPVFPLIWGFIDISIVLS